MGPPVPGLRGGGRLVPPAGGRGAGDDCRPARLSLLKRQPGRRSGQQRPGDHLGGLPSLRSKIPCFRAGFPRALVSPLERPPSQPAVPACWTGGRHKNLPGGGLGIQRRGRLDIPGRETGEPVSAFRTLSDRVWLMPLLGFLVALGAGLPVAWQLGDSLPERAVRVEVGTGWAVFWPFGVDLYPRWVGGRALLRGQNPYSPEVEAEIHQAVYGRPRLPEEPQFGFYYPVYIVVLVGPLLPLPLEVAVRVWGGVNLALLLTLSLTVAWAASSRPPPLILGVVFFSLGLFWPAVLGISVGQYGLAVVSLGALAWGLLRSGRDVPAGAVLALATVKPSISFLPILFVLCWAAARRRFGVVAGFGACLAGLTLLSSLPAGWWVDDFLTAIGGYQVNVGPSFVTWKPAHAFTFPAVLGLLVAGWLLVRSTGEILRSEGLPWAGLVGVLLLNLLLTPHVGIFDLVALLIPLGWLLSRWAGSAPGLVLWLGCVWFPAVLVLGLRADGWWVWAVYPGLVAWAALAEVYRQSLWPLKKAR
ncbi:MAG: hypothetical protein C4316_00340 [Chloroflexota bacterium]